MFGFVTWLNGSLIPFLQIACELSNFQAYLVSFAFYISYTVFALPMASVLRATGYKNGMLAGLLIMALGAVLFIPAAMTRMYALFLLALFVLGAGLTLLQAAVNPYVVVIGPRESAAVRISIMGVLNKLAGVLAPVLFTAFILQGMSAYSPDQLSALSEAARQTQLNALAARLVEPYQLMTAGLLLLALFIWWSPLSEPRFDEADNERGDIAGSVLRHPQLVLGVIALFFYVGVEVIAGDTIALFGKERGVANFGALTAYTMAFMVCGYLTGMLLIPRVLSQAHALAATALLGVGLSLLLVQIDLASVWIWSNLLGWAGVGPVPDAVLLVAALGFANAMVWPAIWPLALDDLSPDEITTGSALLIMAIAGGALLPLAYGALADSLGSLQDAYWILPPCYLVILGFALKGRRLRAW